MKHLSPLLRLIYLLSIACVVILLSCNDETTPPQPSPPIEEPEDTTTTSHDFTFLRLDTLGFSHSRLVDVQIISDTDVWIAGELYIKDSTGKVDDITIFNAAHWDGQRWNIVKIPLLIFTGLEIYDRINTTALYDSTTILFFGDVGGLTVLKNGNFEKKWLKERKGTPLRTVTIHRNIFLTGTDGSLTNYDGNKWELMKTGTDLTLTDVQGTSLNQMYSCGSDYSRGGGIVLRYDGLNWSPLIRSYLQSTGFDSSQFLKTQLYGELESVWIDERDRLYVVGSYAYRYNKGKWELITSLPDNEKIKTVLRRGYLRAISGKRSNDIIVAGQRNTLMHYNGKEWKQLYGYVDITNSRQWIELQWKKDLVVVVGHQGGEAIVLMMKRK